MNKKISLGAALALLVMVATVVFAITWTYTMRNYNLRINDLRERETMYEKFAEVDHTVRPNYYGDISETKLQDSIAKGYVDGLEDTYSHYISAEEYKRMKQEAEGDNVGIGAVINIAPDDFYLLVSEVYPDSPAEIAGMQAGDLIVRVDGIDLSRENSRQMLESIQGPTGSKITLVTRRGGEESAPKELTRLQVAVPTVLNAHLLQDSTVGYLNISDFGERTYDQFNRELLRLMDADATSLIIDLRDTKSDSMQGAARILDKLLPAGQIVSRQNKDGTTTRLYDSDANEIDLPIVVLTNSGTTGTAEVFAQAIKDFGKGRTVGATTAGKAVMQTIYQLPDGSAVELSVATYVTKSGVSFGGTGVKPDFDVAMDTDWTKLIEIEASDIQLTKAREVALGLETAAAPEGASTGAEGSSTDSEDSTSAEESSSTDDSESTEDETTSEQEASSDVEDSESSAEEESE